MNSLSPRAGLRLTQIIGSPLSPGSRIEDRDLESRQLLQLARRNKVFLLYLEALDRKGKLSAFRTEYEEEKARRLSLFETVGRVSQALDDVEHAVFKTLRPYPAIPSDIDVMVLGDDEAYKDAVVTLLKAGYDSLLPGVIDRATLTSVAALSKAADKLTRPTYGPLHISPGGTHLVDPESGFHVDLQRELSVSSIVYMDKTRFRGYLRRRNLPVGGEISVFTPELELAVIIGHSLSERELRLGEFFTLLYCLQEMDEAAIDVLVGQIQKNRLRSGAAAFVSVASALHRAAFDGVPEKLELLQSRLGSAASESRRLVQQSFIVPHQFTSGTLLRILREKLAERRFRRSVVKQAITMLNPRMIRLAYNELRRKG